MVLSKIARIPLKVPMMLPQPAGGSVSACVVFTTVSGGVVSVVESVITTTPANV